MKVSLPRLAILAAVATALPLLATMRPGTDMPVAEASLGSPGGIAALPSAAPAAPGIANQQIPAIIGTGQKAIVVVFCDQVGGVLPAATSFCPDVGGNSFFGSGSIVFELEQVYPIPGAVPMATFNATGSDTLAVTDNAGPDFDAALGVVAVDIDAAAATTGGTQGVNEIVRVRATDEDGESRTVTIVIVDTLLAWGPTGQVSTAAQEQPVWISYHCSVLGRAPLNGAVNVHGAFDAAVDGDLSQGLDDYYDILYGPGNPGGASPGLGWGSNKAAGTPGSDINDVWCGGNTATALFDDSVTFQTDKGILGIGPSGAALQQNTLTLVPPGIPFTYPQTLDPNCGNGQSINVTDVDAAFWYNSRIVLGPVGVPSLVDGCDANGWRNGVVTTELLGTGQVGVGTIKAQQGGGVSPVREINVTFVGEAANSLFITAPDSVGAGGANFTAAIVDQDGRPVGNESVTCTVSPTGGALVIAPQTGTTNSAGVVSFKMVPTGASVVSGEPLTITCVMDSDRSVSATHTLNLSVTPGTESVDLVVGCNFVSWTGADATDPADLAAAVSPASDLAGLWAEQPPPNWAGYSPEFPEVSDMGPVDQLDVISICMTGVGTFERPVL